MGARLMQGSISVYRLNSFRYILEESNVYELNGFDVAKSNLTYKFDETPIQVRIPRSASGSGNTISSCHLTIYINESMGDDHLIPVPQTLVDTIGQTYRFIVKVSDRNLKGQIHTLTVTKVLPLDAPEPVEALVETVSEEPVDGRVKRGSDLVESGEAKRAKSGN
ncbi:hypothetical protein HID58_081693 [Brassica napus]|uniref:Uncharacterized protein n=2 Tax=Brassica napus TaxID=3708 RepID=A0ABQ7Y8I6_BRANA|nr:hypothetical protein HID58_081693 [Brassica napus]